MVIDLVKNHAVVEEGQAGTAAGGVVAVADRPSIQRAAAVGNSQSQHALRKDKLSQGLVPLRFIVA